MRQRPQRRGALAVESAVVFSCLFVVLFAIIVGGMGVYRYQLVAGQAREATRWAAVHAADWGADNGRGPASSQDIIQNAVSPLSAGMDPSALSVGVYWVDQSSGTAYDWDASSRATTSSLATGGSVSNTVRVTVTYQWFPEMLLAGPFYLTSTSELFISY